MTIEQRHEARVRTINLVDVAEYDLRGNKIDEEIGRTLDLSHDGMRLELNHALPLRTTVSLSVALGDKVVELRGRVRSVLEVDETRCEIGILFDDDLEQEVRAALDAWISRS